MKQQHEINETDYLIELVRLYRLLHIMDSSGTQKTTDDQGHILTRGEVAQTIDDIVFDLQQVYGIDL